MEMAKYSFIIFQVLHQYYCELEGLQWVHALMVCSIRTSLMRYDFCFFVAESHVANRTYEAQIRSEASGS